ncbi:hypothetical protein [Hyphomicrobium sp. 99]|uniref:hypothetical protein n=1 Tax=Hyphomicrobium sp. 99 TaxID=1163419 RepID=UPI0012E000F9|nr:hypothetical protein [Hyphomicrobium sp. 99]
MAVGPLHFEVPEIASLDPVALGLGVLAALLLFVLRAGVITTLGVAAAASLLLTLLR